MIIYLSTQKNTPAPISSQKDTSAPISSQKDTSALISSQKNSPAVSVIIPVYNAEKYLSECFDSVLAQTFQNFEVIVVDDCSTDNSVAIIESYAPKFNGRFKFSKTEINSGGGGYIPRNIGLTLANGEYVYFMDADDFLLPTALETLHTVAKEYGTDVVYTGAFYRMNKENELKKMLDDEGRLLLKKNLEDKPNIFIGNNKILQYALTKTHFRTPWVKFLRRAFLLENKITFPSVTVGGDALWTISVCAHSKRFLRLPQPVYIYRFYNEDSIIHKKRSAREQIVHWSSGFMNWLNYFNTLVNEIDFLKKNPTLCYQALRKYFEFAIIYSINLNAERVHENLNAEQVYETLYKNLKDENPDASPLTLPFLISFAYEEAQDLLKINEFKPYLTARIDVRLIAKTNEGNLTLLYLSDEKAEIISSKTENNVLQIHSYIGKVIIVLKSSVDGQIKLNLRGLDIRNPKDEYKRIPYWIDYTKLLVNENIIFNKRTPTWHDKSYKCEIDIKANKEIKIEINWLPHISTT